jgi:hypothetical protein
MRNVQRSLAATAPAINGRFANSFRPASPAGTQKPRRHRPCNLTAQRCCCHNDGAVTAVFQTLPDAAFVVNGARANPDAALVSGRAEMSWLNGFPLAAPRGRVLRQHHKLCRQGRREVFLVT